MFLKFAYFIYLLSGKNISLVNLFFRLTRSEYKVVGENHTYTSIDHAYTTFEFEDIYGDGEEVTDQDYLDYVLNEIQMQGNVDTLLDEGLEYIRGDNDYQFYNRFLYILTNLHDYVTDRKYVELIEACVDKIVDGEMDVELKKELNDKYLKFEDEVLKRSPLDVLKTRGY